MFSSVSNKGGRFASQSNHVKKCLHLCCSVSLHVHTNGTNPLLYQIPTGRTLATVVDVSRGKTNRAMTHLLDKSVTFAQPVAAAVPASGGLVDTACAPVAAGTATQPKKHKRGAMRETRNKKGGMRDTKHKKGSRRRDDDSGSSSSSSSSEDDEARDDDDDVASSSSSSASDVDESGSSEDGGQYGQEDDGGDRRSNRSGTNHMGRLASFGSHAMFLKSMYGGTKAPYELNITGQLVLPSEDDYAGANFGSNVLSRPDFNPQTGQFKLRFNSNATGLEIVKGHGPHVSAIHSGRSLRAFVRGIVMKDVNNQYNNSVVFRFPGALVSGTQAASSETYPNGNASHSFAAQHQSFEKPIIILAHAAHDEIKRFTKKFGTIDTQSIRDAATWMPNQEKFYIPRRVKTADGGKRKKQSKAALLFDHLRAHFYQDKEWRDAKQDNIVVSAAVFNKVLADFERDRSKSHADMNLTDFTIDVQSGWTRKRSDMQEINAGTAGDAWLPQFGLPENTSRPVGQITFTAVVFYDTV